MRSLVASTLAFLFVACSSGITVTPESIGKEVENLGARATIEKLKGSKTWEESLQKIEEGDSVWLAIASQLRAGADASAAVGLDFSVARALTNNPQGVLKLLDGPFEAVNVCTIPYIEVPREVELQHLDEVDQALQGVRAEALAEPRRRCADLILRIRENLTP